MDVRSLGNDINVEFDIRPTAHGYMIVHRMRGGGNYTVTCCCEGKGCVSTTCAYLDGEEISPTCDCSDASPSITCY